MIFSILKLIIHYYHSLEFEVKGLKKIIQQYMITFTSDTQVPKETIQYYSPSVLHVPIIIYIRNLMNFKSKKKVKYMYIQKCNFPVAMILFFFIFALSCISKVALRSEE